jgi:hypothetical protein
MNTQVLVGKAMYTIRGADHLQVVGELVEIQRSTPGGYETLAVAGEDLLVAIEPVALAAVDELPTEPPARRPRLSLVEPMDA